MVIIMIGFANIAKFSNVPKKSYSQAAFGAVCEYATRSIFIFIVDAEQSPGKGENLAKSHQYRRIYYSGWGYNKSGNQQAGTDYTHGHCTP